MSDLNKKYLLEEVLEVLYTLDEIFQEFDFPSIFDDLPDNEKLEDKDLEEIHIYDTLKTIALNIKSNF